VEYFISSDCHAVIFHQSLTFNIVTDIGIKSVAVISLIFKCVCCKVLLLTLYA